MTKPTVVCLCGSTRFWREFQAASLRETLAGKIVLSIGHDGCPDAEKFAGLSPEEWQRVKAGLDELHLRKIDLADEVLILNVGGYVGESTARELVYAVLHAKKVDFFEAPSPGSLRLFADARATVPYLSQDYLRGGRGEKM